MSMVCLPLVAHELRIKSGLTFSCLKKALIVSEAFRPREFKGRSKSGKVLSFQLDFACRKRNNVFIWFGFKSAVVYIAVTSFG